MGCTLHYLSYYWILLRYSIQAFKRQHTCAKHSTGTGTCHNGYYWMALYPLPETPISHLELFVYLQRESPTTSLDYQ